jgi:thiamine biosynthesis lipoprotein
LDYTPDAAYARIDELNAILSDYDADSELMRLCRAGSESAPTAPIAISDDLFRVLQVSHHWSRRSDGAFDVTVGPYVRLWRRTRRQQILPAEHRLEDARRAVGYEKLQLDEDAQTAQLLAADMRLDLGGIGKGFTVDEVLLLLKRLGITRALVDGGGDIAVGEAPPGRRGWRVALRPLDAPGSPPERRLELRHRAVATSGDMNNHITIDGTRYSHVIDPATGLGVTHQSGVSIVADNCMTADALASAVSVLGPQRGLALIDAMPGTQGRIITVEDAAMRIDVSQGFDALPRDK